MSYTLRPVITENERQHFDDLPFLNCGFNESESAMGYSEQRIGLHASPNTVTLNNPITSRNAIRVLGAMLGIFGPIAILVKLFFTESGRGPELPFILLYVFATMVTALAGYLLASPVSKLMNLATHLSWSLYLPAMLILGALWGLISGAAGGVFLFILGAIFGGAVGAMAGGPALIIYSVFHRALSENEMIEMKHFLPVSIGTILTITAYILGL